MNNTIVKDNNTKAQEFLNELDKYRPRSCDGAYTYGCCGQPYVLSPEQIQRKISVQPHAVCPTCFGYFMVTTPAEVIKFDNNYSDITRSWYSYGPTFSGEDRLQKFEKWITDNKYTYKKTYKNELVKWSLSEIYSVIKNIRFCLELFQQKEYGQDYWHTRKDFSDPEIYFLKENNMYETFLELSFVVNLQFRCHVLDALKSIDERMARAGLALM